MGAFCVYGISKSLCKQQADKKTLTRHCKELGRTPTVSEWGAKRDAMAAKLFDEATKRAKISPEFDAPQFARDWIAAALREIKQPMIMALAEKTDAKGERVLKGGAPVMTWVEYKESKNASLF
jgi:hypothetical protein